MAVFKFRLAPVLRYRERLQEEKQWELAVLNEERQRMEADLDRLEQELLRAAKSAAGEEGKLYTAIDLRLHGDYAGLIAKRIMEKRAALEEFNLRLAEKRAQVVEALRGVKTLEHLRQRLEVKFRRKQNIEEQKTVDESAQRQFSSPDGRQKFPVGGKVFPTRNRR